MHSLCAKEMGQKAGQKTGMRIDLAISKPLIDQKSLSVRAYVSVSTFMRVS